MYQKYRVLIQAARPKTLLAGVCPVIIGTCSAFSNLQEINIDKIFISCIILLTAVLIQILTNFVNDLWDFKKGSDTNMRLGPERVVASGKISPQEMLSSIKYLTLTILLLGLFLVYIGGIPILIIGILSIIGAYIYTAGPYPLAHNGLGELFVLIFFGPVASGGTELILINSASKEAILLGIACGLLSTCILIINNTRDIQEDRNTGKKTLASRFGRSFSNFEFLISIILSYIIFFSLFINQLAIISWVLIVSCIILSCFLSFKFIKANTGDDFNYLLPLTGFNLFYFSIITCILILGIS